MSDPSGSGLRTGADYIASIRDDGRRVIVDGEAVRDVTTHPAFPAAVRSVARLWDIAADPANREIMTYPSPTTGAAGVALLPNPAKHRRSRRRGAA